MVAFNITQFRLMRNKLIPTNGLTTTANFIKYNRTLTPNNQKMRLEFTPVGIKLNDVLLPRCTIRTSSRLMELGYLGLTLPENFELKYLPKVLRALLKQPDDVSKALCDGMEVRRNTGKNICHISLGGTICMESSIRGNTPTRSGEELMANVPGLDLIANVKSIEYLKKDSSNLTLEEIHGLVKFVQDKLQDPNVDGIVITHGTDTMEETAFHLALYIKSDKPVVLTGAQKAADEPEPDGPDNIKDAVLVASHPESKGKGVLVVFGHKINPAKYVSKINAIILNPFRTLNENDFPKGAIGEIDWGKKEDEFIKNPVLLPKIRVKYYPEISVGKYLINTKKLELPYEEINDYDNAMVALAEMLQGTTGEELIAFAEDNVDAIIISAFGAGNVNDKTLIKLGILYAAPYTEHIKDLSEFESFVTKTPILGELFKNMNTQYLYDKSKDIGEKTKYRHIPIIVATRCRSGHVSINYESAVQLEKLGTISAHDIHPVKCYVLAKNIIKMAKTCGVSVEENLREYFSRIIK